MREFDLLGALPTGTTLIEASAGTGKTHAIASLAVRYVAEVGLEISQLLLITFGNHAADELRGRIFERLQQVEIALEAIAKGEAEEQADHLAAALALGDAELASRRIRNAIATFSEATILTTHAFCAAMLQELGVLGRWDPTESIGPDDDELARQCANDAYLQQFRAAEHPTISPGQALPRGVEACLTNLDLVPTSGPWFDYAQTTRELYAERKQLVDLCTFNDITARLRDALLDPTTSIHIQAKLRDRFPVVLVDEFQDTDPEQWQILREAFISSERATILIGDPKQSIYGFRGADLNSYLAAHDDAEIFTLNVNYRTDKALVNAVTELFGSSELGSAEVKVQPVRAHYGGSRLAVPGEARLWLRRNTASDLPRPDEAIADDLVAQVGLLLERATFGWKHHPGPVSPSDIAVLVRTGARARQLRAALAAAGIPAILTGSQSVWDQPATQYWITLLRAISSGAQSDLRLAALTPLIGASLTELIDPSGLASANTATLIGELRVAFEDQGVSAVLTLLRVRTDLDARLRSEPEPSRLSTDISHVAELLAAAPTSTAQGLIDFAVSMRGSGAAEHRDSIRIETQEPAVRVMTMHAAKGLQFPIVLLPDTEGTTTRRNRPFSILQQGQRRLYIGPPPAWNDELTKDLQAQTLAEELRLLYVAFTRAQHLVIAWHVARRGSASAKGPLAKLLSAKGWSPNQKHYQPLQPSDLINDSQLLPAASTSTPPLPALTTELRAADWDRVIDQTWRRTSYSGLTSGLHEMGFKAVSDEVEELDLPVLSPQDDLDLPSPMAELPAGTGFGTMVHAAFEQVDWHPDRLETDAAALITELAPSGGLSKNEPAELIKALVLACQTPLDPLTEATLSDLPISVRLPELDFDLPLADQGQAPTVGDLADLMAQHLATSDPLAEYPARLSATPAADSVLNGFLTGSIDAVLRLPNDRFVIIDYKTNRLSPNATVPLKLSHYTRNIMAEAMMQAHYPLQAMLYSVALHRYLGTRLKGYSPAEHLGGVGYLFVRGMAGAATPIVDGMRCGVFSWFPPAALTVAASELLKGRHA